MPDLKVVTFKIQITMEKEQNLQTAETQALNIPVVIQRCLNSFENVVGRVPSEDEIFMDVCNLYDYIDVTNNISKEFGVKIDTDEYDEYDFNTVKDYINWCINNVV